MKYADETKIAVALALQEGKKSYQEIADGLLISSKSVVCRWQKEFERFGYPATFEALEQPNGTGGTQNGTAEQEGGTQENEAEKIAVLAAKNEETPVPKATEQSGTAALFAQHFSLMHIVFYLTSGTACYSMWNALPNFLGLSMLAVFALFSLDSLLKAQNGANARMAEYGRNRVVASELVAAVFHYRLLYKSLLENRESLPFKVFETVKAGETPTTLNGVLQNGVWHNEHLIIYISAGIAALFFVAAFAAADSVLQENKV